MKLTTMLLVVALFAPASALADSGSIETRSASGMSGSITNVAPAPDGLGVSATYTTNFSACSGSSCFWWPRAWEVPASTPCHVDKSYFTYVGDIEETPGTQVGTAVFRPDYNPTRICLYVSHADTEHLVADYVYTAPPEQPPPPVETDPPSDLPPLSIRSGRHYLPRLLRAEFGARFTDRRGMLTASCRRWRQKRVRCRVSWRYKELRYAGSVTFRRSPTDPANRVAYRIDISKRR